MGGWARGPGMVQEPELEDGEDCDYKDDSRIDPDVALSYIGDRVQNILGHLQKDFEGGFSAENLGAKYGGYGSFLPTHQRSPPTWSQPKSPQRTRNPDLPVSLNHHLSESCGHDTSVQVNMITEYATPTGPSKTTKTSSVDASVRQSSSLGSDRVTETLHGKSESDFPSKKSDNPSNQRTMKVRIKLGTVSMVQEMGMESSPEGDSSGESGGSPLKSQETACESLADILQAMTSFPVSGAIPLSPLSDDLINFVKQSIPLVEALPKSTVTSNGASKTSVFGCKKTETAVRSKEGEKSENRAKKEHPGNQLHTETNLKRSCDEPQEEKVMQVKMSTCKDNVKIKAVPGNSCKIASLEPSFGQSCKSEHLDTRSNSREQVVENKERLSENDIRVHNEQSSKDNFNIKRTSFKSHSEVKGVKASLDNYSSRVGMQPASCKQDKVGAGHAVSSLLTEKKSKGNLSNKNVAPKLSVNVRDGGSAALINRSSEKNARLNKKYAVGTSSEHMRNREPVPVRSKNSNQEVSSTKLAHAHKVERHVMEPSVAALSPNEGIVSVYEQAVPAPVVIEEEWVGCDSCQKWRLLPYGRKPNKHITKWKCKMLDWLPGMNRCDISEEETTNAVQSTYPANTIPQYNSQDHADRTRCGVNSAGARVFDLERQVVASDQNTDQKKKQKLKREQSILGTGNPVPPFSDEKNLQRLTLKECSKELNQSIVIQNAKSKLGLQHMNESASAGSKRKEDHIIGDDMHPKKKIRKDSVHVDGRLTGSTATCTLNSNSLRINVGKQGMNHHDLTFDMPNREAEKDGKKNNLLQGRKIHLKVPKYDLHGSSDIETPGKETYGGQVTPLKRKLKGPEEGQHQVEKLQHNGSSIQQRKVSVKEESKEFDVQLDKKTRVSQTAGKQFNGCKADVPRTQDIESKPRLPGSNEGRINRVIVKEPLVVKLRAAMPRVTSEDIHKLRKDLGCEEMSTAAASSSSKISDTRKNRITCAEVRGSPGESVSSSPVRIARKVKMIPTGGASGNLVPENCPGPTNVGCFTEEKNKDQSGLVFPQKNPNNILPGNSVKQNGTQTKPWNGKVRLNLSQGNKKDSICSTKSISGSGGSLKRTTIDSKRSDASVMEGASKSLSTTLACSQNGTNNFISPNESMALEASLSNKNVSIGTASTALRKAEDVLREAEELRVHANLIKNSGFNSESIYEFFKAGLKFLHGASLLEDCNKEGSERMETNPMQMYGTAAKLCKICACEYEKDNEMAAAALAYKCSEVAYLRVVYFKSSTTQRVCKDLHASMQMVPQGESPSSSASDLDNLNNLASADKTNLSKGNASHHGNHITLPRKSPNFIQLLDFTRDVTFAMESAKKSQAMFVAAQSKLEGYQNKESVVSVKRVLDFSFEDVEEFIRLMWVAFNSIDYQGTGGC